MVEIGVRGLDAPGLGKDIFGRKGDGQNDARGDGEHIDVGCAIAREDALQGIFDAADLGTAFEHGFAKVERVGDEGFIKAVIGHMELSSILPQ